MWAGVGELDANAFYAVTVEYAHQDQTWYDETPRLRTTRWELSEHSYLLDLSTDGRFRWWVQVMRQIGVDGSGNPIVVEASPPSIPRTLFWRAPDDPAANTPVPPPA